MRLALVLTDVSIPPREGLHQQTLLLIKVLRERGHLVDIFPFARRSTGAVSEDALAEQSTGTVRTSIHYYSGSSLLFALTRARHVARGMIAQIEKSKYDAVILDGVVACSLSPRIVHPRVILNWVDPGSVRYRRMFDRANALRPKAAYFVSSRLYRLLERRLRSPKRPWVFVSAADVEFVQQIHRRQPVVHVPVILSLERPENTYGSPVRCESMRPAITIYVDGRSRNGREALLEALRELAHWQRASSMRVTVLARVEIDEQIRVAAGDLQLAVFRWVDDPESLLSQSDVVVLPDLVGTGIKNRALQALALAPRCLGTKVALEGVEVDSEVLSEHTYSPGDLVDRLEKVLASPPNGAEAARQVRSEYSADAVGTRWESLFAG